MATKKMSNKVKFLIVVLGLFTVIGLVIGGTYVLDEQGLISAGNMSEGGGERLEGSPADFEGGGEMPARPDGDEDGGMGFNSQALSGLFKAALQISIVVVVIAGGQSLFSWSRQRQRRAPAHSG